MVADHSTDFQKYLEAVCDAYKHWWRIYTLTDAVSQQHVGQERLQSPFDFGLMMQTVKPQSERGEAHEKTERLPVLEGLRKYASEHVLLVGRPGSGKSTALAQLLVEEAHRGRSPLNPPFLRGEEELELEPPLKRGAGGIETKIPVLVELRQYRTSVLDLIRDFLMRHRLRLSSAEIETLLFEGRFLLLFDGVNELPNKDARRELKAFRQNYAATLMVFTTRDLCFEGDLGIEKKLEMQPLTEPQMQEFVLIYLPEQSEQMLGKLRTHLWELGQTPLLLWMLCKLFRETGNIPPNLGLVFRCFAQSYERKIKEDVPVSEESRRWWHELLQHLAFEMMQGETATEMRVNISRREAEVVLAKFLQGKVDYPPSRAKEWLEDLLEHHLIQTDSNDQIEFRHQLLQEYYAAECLLQQLPQINDDSLKQNYLNYVKWTPSLALMLALADEAQSVQALRVVKLALEVYIRLGAWLAGESKPELQVQTVALVSEQDIPQLLKIDLLSVTRSDSAIPALLQALADGDSDMKGLIIEALANIGTEAANSVISSNSSLLQPDLILVEAEPFDWDFHDQFRTQLLSGILKELEQIEEDRQKVKQLVPMFIQAFSQMLCNYLADGYEWLILADHSLVTADDPLVPTNKTTLRNKSCMSVGYALGLIGGAELLPDLFKILLAETSNPISIRFAIEMIQRHYQYYNYTLYKLATSPPPQEESITNELLAGTKIYIEKVEKIDCGSASIGAVNIDSIIPGNQIGTQHNK